MLRTLVPKPRKTVKIQLVQRIRGVNGLSLAHHYSQQGGLKPIRLIP